MRISLNLKRFDNRLYFRRLNARRGTGNDDSEMHSASEILGSDNSHPRVLKVTTIHGRKVRISAYTVIQAISNSFSLRSQQTFNSFLLISTFSAINQDCSVVIVHWHTSFVPFSKTSLIRQRNEFNVAIVAEGHIPNNFMSDVKFWYCSTQVCFFVERTMGIQAYTLIVLPVNVRGVNIILYSR